MIYTRQLEYCKSARTIWQSIAIGRAPAFTLSRPRKHQSIRRRENSLETASCAGLPQVKFSDRPIARSFVAFIDRRSRRDHLAEYNIRVINVLRDAGVFVEVFQFDHDPMLCRSANSGEYKGLQEIISGFSKSVMLLFVEAEQIMDPATGRLMRWVAFFRDVPHSFLLTPPGDTDPLEFIRHQGRKGSMVHILLVHKD